MGKRSVLARLVCDIYWWLAPTNQIVSQARPFSGLRDYEPKEYEYRWCYSGRDAEVWFKLPEDKKREAKETFLRAEDTEVALAFWLWKISNICYSNDELRGN